jgi:hypothetical protein
MHDLAMIGIHAFALQFLPFCDVVRYPVYSLSWTTSVLLLLKFMEQYERNGTQHAKKNLYTVFKTLITGFLCFLGIAIAFGAPILMYVVLIQLARKNLDDLLLSSGCTAGSSPFFI